MNIDFLIPLYVEHEDRLTNITNVISILKSYGANSIHVREYYKNYPKFNGEGCSYTSVQLVEDNFNKMQCINEMVELCSKPYLSIYDADVVVFKKDLIQAISLLDSGVDVVYPYNGQFLSIPKKMISDFVKTYKIDLEKCELANPNSYGGCVIYKRSVFEEGGKCNPKFKNVGFDDNELYIRFSRLGYNIQRTSGPLLHMEHFRSETSVEHSIFLNHNMQIYNSICTMPIEKLKEEIKSWSAQS